MKLLFIFFFFLPHVLFSQESKPAIVILGVTHSSQLVNWNQQPAAVRAYIKHVKPDAILIERSPEEFLRNDFYEFTYEQQFLSVPFARQNQIPLFPIDWLPKDEDLLLSFSVKNLETPNFTRNPSGFWGFTVFKDIAILFRSLCYAEDSAIHLQNSARYANYPKKHVDHDFPRRLFLYRTFLQAQRIKAVAKNFRKKDTLLVIIGDMHKYDIEQNLIDAGYTIINSRNFENISSDEIKENYDPSDAFAIASFNLLGIQGTTNFVNQRLLDDAMKRMSVFDSPESAFFKVKYLVEEKKISPKEAINKYEPILKRISKSTSFSWTGVKDKSRLDSYFDPFGNMTLWQRLHLELARAYYKVGNINGYKTEKELLVNDFQGLKQSMLLEYWNKYVEK